VTRAVVIGGGIGGLATAGLLARNGYEVVLLEKRDELGGRAGSWERDGFRFDTGPSWYLMPEVFDHFFRLMGTTADEQLRLVTLDPGFRVYFEGEQAPIDIAASRDENVALFESIEPGSGVKLESYLDSARETYTMAKRRFLYTSFQSFRDSFSPDVLLRGPRFARLLLQSLWSRASQTVKDHRLRQVLAYPAVFLGASPFSTPSMYHLMSHLDLEDGVLYPVGGIHQVIEAIARVARGAGAELRTGAEVTAIRVADGRASGVAYRDASGEHELEADLVVSGADLHHTETRLLDEPHRTYGEDWWRSKVAGPSALLIYLGVRGALPQLEHHTLLFSRDWRRNFSDVFPRERSGPSRLPDPASVYVCKPSGVDPSVAPEGHENLFVLVPIAPDPELGGGGVDGAGDPLIEATADRVIRQIADWIGEPDLADRVVVRRTIGPADFADDLNSWQGSALGPAHTLGQSAFFRAGNASTKVDGLYYVGGSTIPGIGLPMCLISAEVLLKRLRGDVSAGPLPVPASSASAAPAASAR